MEWWSEQPPWTTERQTRWMQIPPGCRPQWMQTLPPWTGWHRLVKILPCPKLHLRAGKYLDEIWFSSLWTSIHLRYRIDKFEKYTIYWNDIFAPHIHLHYTSPDSVSTRNLGFQVHISPRQFHLHNTTSPDCSFHRLCQVLDSDRNILDTRVF